LGIVAVVVSPPIIDPRDALVPPKPVPTPIPTVTIYMAPSPSPTPTAKK
jgi:rod shape-determining protein MreC